MTKEELTKAIETTIYKDIEKELENSPMPVKGTPFEGMAIQAAMNKSAKSSEEYIKKMSNQPESTLPLNDKEVINLVKTAYANVYNSIFE